MLAAVALALALASTTPSAAKVQDTSYVEANGDRAQRLSILVPAPPSAVWKAFDNAEGWKRWAVSVAWVDFRPGGQIETSYSPAAHQGERDNIKNQIVAIDPGRMLVFRNVQAPPTFKDPELFARVTSIVELAPAAKGRTLVTISGVGYGQGPAWDSLYAQFLAGNAYSLEKLRDAFTRP